MIYQSRSGSTLPFETWLDSSDDVIRESVRELVYVHGKYWCGAKMDDAAKKEIRKLMLRVKRRSHTPHFQFVKEAISILAQTHYGL